MQRPRIGLVLGSGSARGWAHIGVIRALEEEDIRPDVVCGSSIGALVGAAYVSGNLDNLEQWVKGLTWWDIARFMDVKLAGGFIEGVNLMRTFENKVEDVEIEELERRFGAVTTNLRTGRELWLQRGSLLEAVRASIALPGLFTPVKGESDWLVDGGLVNPVPISLARAMDAEVVLAVNLNGDILGRHLTPRKRRAAKVAETPPEEEATDFGGFLDQIFNRVNASLKEKVAASLSSSREDSPAEPGLFEVIASAINIMQDRITRSRMAGDPPEVLLAPRLAHVGLLEFDRAQEAIDSGYEAARRQMSAIRFAVGLEEE